MGAGIHTQVQICRDGEWETFDNPIFKRYDEMSSSPFEEQNYGLFGLLADVRNYARIPIITELKGLPKVEFPAVKATDIGFSCMEPDDPWPLHWDNHSATWYLLSELLEFDYDVQFENRRDDSGDTLPAGDGQLTTIRRYIGEKYFEDLDKLSEIADSDKIRVIISFDS